MPLGRILFFRFLCPLFLIFGLSSCAVHSWEEQYGVPVPEHRGVQTTEEQKAEYVWKRLNAQAGAAEVMSGPFRISAVLRYTDAENKNTRVSALLWGNGDVGNPYPLRLDLLAGVGSVVAKIKEDSDSFIAYVPDKKSVFVQSGSTRTLDSFGVPIPLSLSDLTLILSGRAGNLLLPPPGERPAPLPPYSDLTDEGIKFTVADAKLPGILEVSSLGVPLSWRELQEGGWLIAFEPKKMNPMQPEKLRISHPKGYSALIVVNEQSRVSPPYSGAQLDLPLPPGTETRPLQSATP